MNDVYEKLTPERKMLVDMVLKNLEEGTGLWQRGWKMSGAPESIRGTKYKGINNFILSIITMLRGYKDNRWVTFNQMKERDWLFKSDGEGESLGKGAGVGVEYFELRDRLTKQRFDQGSLLGLDSDEKHEYMQDNVYPIRKFYRVFNGDLIEGIPQKEITSTLDESGRSERAENILEVWNDNESKIIYGGSHAFYNSSNDEIHVPEREDFVSLSEFYGTTLHEIGHSTGHENRLNRELKNGYGTPEYAVEELRAEIASMFMSQDLELELSESTIQNNSAYLGAWKKEISNDPNVLFTAIVDAEKISRFVLSKEKQKEIEPYALVTEQNEYGDDVFKMYMIAPNGQTQLAINYEFSDLDALKKECDKMQSLPFWEKKQFKEVDFETLKTMSVDRANKLDVKEEKSSLYILPSEAVAKNIPNNSIVDMSGRGVESLTRMSDREVYERASKTKNGDKFLSLYNGGSVLKTDEQNERSLMSRLAMFCNGDKEQLIRIFKSSGQFRESKTMDSYDKMAKESIAFINRIQSEKMPQGAGTNKSFGAKNSK